MVYCKDRRTLTPNFHPTGYITYPYQWHIEGTTGDLKNNIAPHSKTKRFLAPAPFAPLNLYIYTDGIADWTDMGDRHYTAGYQGPYP